MNDENKSLNSTNSGETDNKDSQIDNVTPLQNSSESPQNVTSEAKRVDVEKIYPSQTSANVTNKEPDNEAEPRSKFLVSFLRFLVVGGGLFIVIVVGLAFSFSACFTIKGPPPPECGPVSFVSLIIMPVASLLFLIPLARKIK